MEKESLGRQMEGWWTVQRDLSLWSGLDDCGHLSSSLLRCQVIIKKNHILLFFFNSRRTFIDGGKGITLFKDTNSQMNEREKQKIEYKT